MRMLTKTFLVTGRNRNILLQRLKKYGVSVFKIQIIDEKRAKITIDEKDTPKYFAICKNSWYNKELKIGGICAPFYLMIKKSILTVFLLVFFAITYFADFLFLGAVYQGEAVLYKRQIEDAFSDVGIKKYSAFSQTQLDSALAVLQKSEDIAFITLKKSGSKAIVYLKTAKALPDKLQTFNSDFIASEDMRILNITVYSGTAMVQKGDFVKKGQVIAKASNVVKETEVPTLLTLAVSAECIFEYIYESANRIDDSTKQNAFVMAKFMLGDYQILSHSFENIDNNKLKVIIKYEKNLIGG